MLHRKARPATLLACCMFAAVASADPDHTYLEENGIVVFEVEDAVPGEGWTLKTDLADFSGTGYFEWTGPNSTSLSAAGRGTITYHFRIQTAGNYQVRWRSHIALGDDNKEHNDSWIRFATGVNVPEEHPLNGWTKNFMNALGSWSWVSQTVDHVGEPIRQYFAAGDHTLEISGRSQGHAIDRISLYRYEDVTFNSSSANGWDLSKIVTGDGTLVDPNEVDYPTDPPAEITRENLNIADEAWQDHPINQCIDNSLALTATDIAAFNQLDSSGEYIDGEYLPVSFADSALLMKFDMSLVPPTTSATLEYSTGEQAANGQVVYSLGSHSNWPLSSESTQYPDSMLELGTAAGGWEGFSRHQSSLTADLLANDINTLIVTRGAESESLQVYSEVASELSPRLMLSGDDGFCATWQANVDAFNTPVEEVVEEIVEPEPTEQPDTTPEPESEMDAADTEGASLSWWWLLSAMMLAVRAGNRNIFRD